MLFRKPGIYIRDLKAFRYKESVMKDSPQKAVYGNCDGTVSHSGDQLSLADRISDRCNAGKYTFGRRVNDPFFSKSELLKKITDRFSAFALFDDFTPDPTLASVTKGITAFLKSGADSMIALGGGIIGELIATDITLNPLEAMVKVSEKNGLFEALDLASVWLERALKK